MLLTDKRAYSQPVLRLCVCISVRPHWVSSIAKKKYEWIFMKFSAYVWHDIRNNLKHLGEVPDHHGFVFYFRGKSCLLAALGRKQTIVNMLSQLGLGRIDGFTFLKLVLVEVCALLKMFLVSMGWFFAIFYLSRKSPLTKIADVIKGLIYFKSSVGVLS